MPPKKKAARTNPTTKTTAKSPTAAPSRQTTLGPASNPLRINAAPSPSNFQTFSCEVGSRTLQCHRRGGNVDAPPGLIVTHGAGGSFPQAATTEFAVGVAGAGTGVVYFEGSPLSVAARVREFRGVGAATGCRGALGGRSMGARAAAQTALEDGVAKKLVLLSYPLVGAQKGDVRDEVLKALKGDVEVLFVSGDGDKMGDLDHFRKVMGKMKAKSWLVEVKGADHGMTLKPNRGTTSMREKTGAIAAAWLKERSEDKRYCLAEWDAAQGKAVDSGWQVDPRREDIPISEETSTAPTGKKRKRG